MNTEQKKGTKIKVKKVPAQDRKRIAHIEEQVKNGKLANFTTISAHKEKDDKRNNKKFDPDASDLLLKHSFGVAINSVMKEWITEECKKRSLKTGYKVSPADVVRSLIDQEMKDEELVQYVSPFGAGPSEDFSKLN